MQHLPKYLLLYLSPRSIQFSRRECWTTEARSPRRIINAIRVAEARVYTRGSAGIRLERGVARHAERARSHLDAVGRRGDIYSITKLTSSRNSTSLHLRMRPRMRAYASRIIYRYRLREGTLIKGAYRQLFLILFSSRFVAVRRMIGFMVVACIRVMALEVMLRVFQVFRKTF